MYYLMNAFGPVEQEASRKEKVELAIQPSSTPDEKGLKIQN